MGSSCRTHNHDINYSSCSKRRGCRESSRTKQIEECLNRASSHTESVQGSMWRQVEKAWKASQCPRSFFGVGKDGKFGELGLGVRIVVGASLWMDPSDWVGLPWCTATVLYGGNDRIESKMEN